LQLLVLQCGGYGVGGDRHVAAGADIALDAAHACAEQRLGHEKMILEQVEVEGCPLLGDGYLPVAETGLETYPPSIQKLGQ